MKYIILTPPEAAPGPFCAIYTTDGEPVAFQVPNKWAERIVTGLNFLDASKKAHRVESYIEEIRGLVKDE